MSSKGPTTSNTVKNEVAPPTAFNFDAEFGDDDFLAAVPETVVLLSSAVSRAAAPPRAASLHTDNLPNLSSSAIVLKSDQTNSHSSLGPRHDPTPIINTAPPRMRGPASSANFDSADDLYELYGPGVIACRRTLHAVEPDDTRSVSALDDSNLQPTAVQPTPFALQATVPCDVAAPAITTFAVPFREASLPNLPTIGAQSDLIKLRQEEAKLRLQLSSLKKQQEDSLEKDKELNFLRSKVAEAETRGIEALAELERKHKRDADFKEQELARLAQQVKELKNLRVIEEVELREATQTAMDLRKQLEEEHRRAAALARQSALQDSQSVFARPSKPPIRLDCTGDLRRRRPSAEPEPPTTLSPSERVSTCVLNPSSKVPNTTEPVSAALTTLVEPRSEPTPSLFLPAPHVHVALRPPVAVAGKAFASAKPVVTEAHALRYALLFARAPHPAAGPVTAGALLELLQALSAFAYAAPATREPAPGHFSPAPGASGVFSALFAQLQTTAVLVLDGSRYVQAAMMHIYILPTTDVRMSEWVK